MIKKTIEISRQPVHLSARLDQLVLQPIDSDKKDARTIPCEDIGLVMIDQPRCSMTQGALEALLRSGAAVVVCGRDHLPAGLMLPTCRHTEQVARLRLQIEATKPTLKRLWQQIVRAKMANHAATMPPDHAARRKLAVLRGEVKSGDTTNVEGQAARVHWAAWREGEPKLKAFRRDPNGTDPANVFLNYGYATLRAAIARALVLTGLHPALGIHHHNRSNAFCLADDLMEPLRPMIDRRVRRLIVNGEADLCQSVKACLLDVLMETVETDGAKGTQTGPLLVSLPGVTASLVEAYRNRGGVLSLPKLQEADA
jgi:CRISPR-associated protein Cas1